MATLTVFNNEQKCMHHNISSGVVIVFVTCVCVCWRVSISDD